MSIAAQEYTKQGVCFKPNHISLAHSFTLLEAYAVALDWNYMARDFIKLKEINAIEVLRIDSIDITQMYNPEDKRQSATENKNQQISSMINSLKMKSFQKAFIGFVTRMTEKELEDHGGE
jgi:hypothetical protein